MSIKSYKTWLDYVFVVSKKIDQKSKEIIIKGFTEENKDLKQYFLREFKKAFALDYSETEFFEGLLDVISLFKEQIVHQMNEEKNRLHDKLIEAKESINSDSEAAQSLIQSITERLTQIKPEDEFLDLQMIGANVKKKMPYADLLSLEAAIKEARFEVTKSTETIKGKTNNKKIFEFKDFFLDLNIAEIEAIQKKFKRKGDLEIAILIEYLLNEEIIELILDNKTGKSRASFYRLLKGDEFKNATVLNRKFQQGTNAANISPNDPRRTEVIKTVTKLLSKK